MLMLRVMLTLYTNRQTDKQKIIMIDVLVYEESVS